MTHNLVFVEPNYYKHVQDAKRSGETIKFAVVSFDGRGYYDHVHDTAKEAIKEKREILKANREQWVSVDCIIW